MGGQAEHAIRESLRCLVQHDLDGAAKVVEDDKKLDALEIETEQRAVQLIALRAPMAADLRDIVAAMKISSVVERIGDYAKNIAKRVPLLEAGHAIEPLSLLPEMGRMATEMVHDVLNAFVERDAEAAVRVMRTRQGGRRFLQLDLPHAADLHDGKSEQYRPVGALVVHRQECRAGRRPRNQYRRDGLLCRDRRAYVRPPARRRIRSRIWTEVAMLPKRLLLVEDDRALAELVSFHFDRAGYAVTRTGDGEEALILADEVKPDLVLLDWMIEGISGIEVCRRLRRRQATANVPIIMLTARGEEDDRIRGLETGADDYMTKPFSPKELVARAGAVLRRVRPALAAEALSYAGLEMDLVAHRVRRDGQSIQLGPTEYRLLRHFLENPGRVFSRQQLLETVWPHSEDIELRTVDVHIRRLRLALGEPDLIRTVRVAGYALDAEGVA